MRLRFIISVLIITFLPGHSQNWKQYPYVPEGSVFSFPADEGRHPDEVVEWWYIAGHLKGLATGTNYSFMLTYFAYPYHGFDGFRILNLCNDDTGEFYDETQPLLFLELGQDSLNIKAMLLTGTVESWTHKKDMDDHLIPFEYDISATSANGSIHLGCVSTKPPIFLGDSGLFYQGAESYTYYYSQTMNAISGTITFKDIEEEVKGTAWIDRQFGGFNQVTGERYEWLFVQLSNGMDLNIWNVFTGDNQLPDTSTFKHITICEDTANHFTTTDFKLERMSFHFMPDSVMCYSQKWHLTSPENQLDLFITTLHNHTEVQLPFRFYEGSTDVYGTVNETPVTGKGFVELLKTYENPLLRVNEPADLIWNGNSPISWHLSNPDDGRPLLYDLEYRTDLFENYLNVQSGISDTLFYWNSPPLATGDSCWFRVKGYSIDTTLMSYSSGSQPFIYMPENTSTTHPELENTEPSPFRLFPNPARKVMNIEFNQELHSFRYQICDLTGKKLSESFQTIGGRSLNISIKNLAPGSYILRISMDSEEFSAIFQVHE